MNSLGEFITAQLYFKNIYIYMTSINAKVRNAKPKRINASNNLLCMTFPR